MPLVKRTIEPKHLCRGALPDGVTNELECVTNSTLAAIIKQLGGLSRHAEDIFGELFNEANSFYMRMNSLQERVDLLAVKVTQLDSTVEEVSLQDINMRKAFKSSTIQDQQVVSRNSIPNPVMEVYQRCDKPPPLNILTPYRDDKKDGLKFYTDPSYFFNLWKEKMLQATENKRKEKRRQKQEQKHTEDPTREVKKVRKARNRRQEWNMMAYDKEFRPDTRLTPSPYHGMSSEGSLSPDRSGMSDEHSYPASPNHPQEAGGAGADGKDAGPTQTQSLDRAYRPPASSTSAAARQHSLGRVQAHGPPLPDSALNGPRPTAAKEYRHATSLSKVRDGHQILEHIIPPAPPPPPPLIPSSQTAFDSTSGPQSLAPESTLPRKGQVPLIPMSDARSDLLAAIRRGIQLRKVQEQREQEAKKEPVGNDVATILSRRIAVEYSESDEDSEPEENEWSD
ncbi:Wiskott-Aldrich syndrome protein family member 3 [Anabarilius grahami]|uniref:Wiskott-Aldrich syndrome protein family member n=1 Tax=Anabarilius grahami TaxID=495550 RepID=A0A3N0XUH7_ANAGA|nr:Wiskott-Aldrich syndrome protein family member 3 [Anabarilius grahami]